MPQGEVSAAIEEYLEHIFRLQEAAGVARTGDVAKRLGVSPSTVVNVVKWLERRGLVMRQPYRGIRLTEKGRKAAIQAIRKHRLAERLLTDLLHMDWDKVHEAACKLEHGLTEEIMESLERGLGGPRTCPHGNPLPTKHGEVVEEEVVPLADLDEGEGGVIAKIVEEEGGLLRYLSKLRLLPGAEVEVLERSPLGDLIAIRVGGERCVLSHRVASVIYARRVR
ncbi:MAG: metal-dependent transcriptional regulator [Candidatus Nezhaarchaeales archaeon]